MKKMKKTKITKLNFAVPTIVLWDVVKETPIAQIGGDGEIIILCSRTSADFLKQVIELSNNFNIIYNSL